MLDSEEYDIEVELTLLPTEESGLSNGLYSGTRSFHFYLDDILWIATFFLPDREILFPGETTHAFVRFFFRPDLLLGRLHVGKSFLLKNGKTIGKGVILSLLHFDKHAEEARRREEEEKAKPSDQNRKRIPPPWERPRHRPRKKKTKTNSYCSLNKDSVQFELG